MTIKTKEEVAKTETETTSEVETEVDSTSSSDSILGEGLKLEEEGEEEKVVEEDEEKVIEEETPAEKYTLELGEESSLSADDLAKLQENAEAYGLSEEQAKAMLADAEATYGQGYNKFETAIKEHSDSMKAELLNDPAFKTEEARAASFATMGTAVSAFGGEDGGAELVKFLKTNAGNNIHLAKFILNIGEQLKSDTPVGKGKNEEKKEVKSREESLYPSFF